MEANGFDTETGWEGRSSFSKQLLTVTLLIDIIFEDEDETIQVRIYEVDGNNTERIGGQECVTLEKAQEFILNYFF